MSDMIPDLPPSPAMDPTSTRVKESYTHTLGAHSLTPAYFLRPRSHEDGDATEDVWRPGLNPGWHLLSQGSIQY